MLVDSGATHSFIRESSLPEIIVHLMNQAANPLKTEDRSFRLKSATETKSIVCKTAELPFRLKGWYGKHRFIVSDEIQSETGILGLDFLKANGAVVDHENETILLRGSPKNEKPESVPERYNLNLCKVAEPIRIEPLTETLMSVEIDGKSADSVVFEPKADDRGLLFARSLNTVLSDNKILVVMFSVYQ